MTSKGAGLDQHVGLEGAGLGALGRVHFDASLYPHRALGPRGFRRLMIAVGILSLGIGWGFWALGAWPVMGFLGLDLLLLYGAFRLSFRAQRLRERVRLFDDALEVTRIHPSGQEDRWQLEPAWARVAVEDVDPYRSRLFLKSRERVVELGSFLAPAEQRDFAQALMRALDLRRMRLAGA